MRCTLGRVVVSTVVTVGLMIAVAFAESTVFSGTVKSVDAAKGTLVITTEEDNTKQFSAPAAQLQGVKPGHEVDVEVVDGKVQSLQNFSTDN